MTKVRNLWSLFLLPIIWITAQIMVWELGLIRHEKSRMVHAGLADHPTYTRLIRDEKQLKDDLDHWGYAVHFGKLRRVRAL